MLMLPRSLIVLVLAGTALLVGAEGERGTGLLPDSPQDLAWLRAHQRVITHLDLNDTGLARLTAERRASTSARGGIPFVGPLPTAVDNSTSPAFPPVGDQGALGSCVSFAVVYYTATYEIARLKGWTASGGDQSVIRSPKFTYNIANAGADTGSTIGSTLSILSDHGVPTWSTWPYNSNPYEWPLSGAVWKEALRWRIGGFASFADTTSSAGITAMKTALANGYLLPFTTCVTSWHQRLVGNDPGTAADDAFVGQKICDYRNGSVGPHAMTMVGYNDAIWTDLNGNGIVEPGERGAFKVVNNWGTGDWNGGFRWLAYDALFAFSQVTPVPIQGGRQPALRQDEVSCFLLDAKDSAPTLYGRVTASHRARNNARFILGFVASDSVTSESWEPTIGYAGGARTYAGLPSSSAAVPATFYFDLSRLAASHPTWTTVRLVAEDGYVGYDSSPYALTVSDFSLERGDGSTITGATYAPASQTVNNATLTATITLPQATVEAPVFLTPPGLFVDSTTVQVSCPTTGATVRWTTDGSTPTMASPPWFGSALIFTTTTVRFAAFKAGMRDSAVTSGVFTRVSPVQPTLNTGLDLEPGRGVGLAGASAWSLTTSPTHDGVDCLRSGAIADGQSSTVTVRTDGPCRVSWWWKTSCAAGDTLSVAINQGATVAAIAGDTPWTAASLRVPAGTNWLWFTYQKDSAITLGADAGYLDEMVVTPITNQVEFALPAGSYVGVQSVALTCATAGSVIHYTTDGSVPTSASATYTAPLTISTTTTLRTIACTPGWLDSDESAATYTLAAVPPTFDPPGGATTAATIQVTLSSSTPGAVIRYTTLGTAPTLTSPIASGPITISSTATIRAITTAPGMQTSAESAASYTLPSLILSLGVTNITRPYGDPNPAFSITSGGFQDGDTLASLIGSPVITTAADSLSPPGIYPVLLSGYSSYKYRIIYSIYDYISVIRRNPVIGWTPPASPIYGLTLGTVASTLTVDLPGTWSLPADVLTRYTPGTYSVLASFTPSNPTVHAEGTKLMTFTVQPAPLTLSAPVASRPYGQANPPFTVLATGFIGSDTVAGLTPAPTVSCTASATTPPGTYPLTVTSGTWSSYTITTVPGSLTITKAPTAITWQPPRRLLSGEALGALQLDAIGSTTGAITFSPPAGTILPQGTTIVTATFTPADSACYLPASATAAVVVQAGTVSWPTPPPAAYGTVLLAAQQCAVSTIPGSFHYDQTPGMVLQAGVVTLGAQFSPDDPLAPLERASTSFTVTKAPLVVTAQNVTRRCGEANPAMPLHYSGFLWSDSAANLTQLPLATCSATAGSPAGTYPITVSGGAAANYDLIPGPEAILTVVKRSPTLTWATPASITVGTALSVTQLNATTAEPGSITYTPATGTSLPAGSHTLVAAFTPATPDQADPATASVVLVVAPASSSAAPVTPIMPTAAAGGGGGGGGGGGCGLGGLGCVALALLALGRRRTLPERR